MCSTAPFHVFSSPSMSSAPPSMSVFTVGSNARYVCLVSSKRHSGLFTMSVCRNFLKSSSGCVGLQGFERRTYVIFVDIWVRKYWTLFSRLCVNLQTFWIFRINFKRVFFYGGKKLWLCCSFCALIYCIVELFWAEHFEASATAFLKHWKSAIFSLLQKSPLLACCP